MESIEQKIAAEKDYRKTGKYILIGCIIFSFVMLLGLTGYWVTHRSEIGQWQSIVLTLAVTLNTNFKFTN